MSHPQNRGDRLLNRSRKLARAKRICRYPGFFERGFTVAYARNRGVSWRNAPVRPDYWNDGDVEDFHNFRGRYADEPVYIKRYGRGNTRRYWKKECSSRARKNRRFSPKKSNAYRRVLDLDWILY